MDNSPKMHQKEQMDENNEEITKREGKRNLSKMYSYT